MRTNQSGPRRLPVVALLAAGLLILQAGAADGQVGVATGTCPGGMEPHGVVGITSFECTNCTLRETEGGRLWSFTSEPRVRVVEPGSPADGKIREDDAIVAIDGHLITTAEGGRRLANLEPDRTVSMVIRSGNRERTIELVPRAECPPDETHVAVPVPAPAVGIGAGEARAVAAPRPPAAPAIGVGVAVGPVPRPTYRLLPSGWFGFGIRCTDCRWSVQEAGGSSEWEFSEPPEISSVESGSPAEAAGLRRGDVLLEIDGVPLVSGEGGRRFGSIEPQETVRWTYRRDGATRSTTATAARRPDVPAPPSAPEPATEVAGAAPVAYASPDVSRLRYSGVVAGASVEVRGAGSVIVNIIEPGREIEIVTSDSRTRIRVDDTR